MPEKTLVFYSCITVGDEEEEDLAKVISYSVLESNII